MKSLSALLFFVLPVYAFATQINLTGNISLYDGESASGATIEFVSEVDPLLKGGVIVDDASGDFSLNLYVDDDLYSPTQLYNITVKKAGYTDFKISKVISSDFRLENVVLVPVGTDAYKPYLDIIAKSSERKNIVAWMRDKDLDIDYYIIKRKNAQGVYDSIASVAYDAEFSLYIDEESDEESSYFYLIQAVFNDGTKSLESNTQKSFYLDLTVYSIRENDGKEIDFDLDVFEGLDYDLLDKIDRVEIQKSKDGEEFTTYLDILMDQVDYENYWNYLDEDTLFSPGTYVYKAILHYKEECNPSVFKTDSGPFSQSISNLAEAVVADENPTDSPTGTPTGIDTEAGIIDVFPIPANEQFTVTGQSGGTVTIMTVVGEVIGTYTLDESVTFDASTFQSGIYLITVECGGVIKGFRQIIE